MSAKFIFFQEVKVRAFAKLEKYRGLIGFIGGITPVQAENAIRSYAVYLPDKEISVIFNENELQGTGRFFKYKDFYDGSHARVSPEGELLEVHIVDEVNKEKTDG